MNKYIRVIIPPERVRSRILNSIHSPNGKLIKDCASSIRDSYFLATDYLVRKTFREEPPQNLKVEQNLLNISKSEWLSNVGCIWDKGVKTGLIDLGIIFHNPKYKNAEGGYSQSYKIETSLLESKGWNIGKIETKNLTQKRKNLLAKKSQKKNLSKDRYFCPKMKRFTIQKKQALDMVNQLTYSKGANKGHNYSPLEKLLVSEQIHSFNKDNYIYICSTGREFNKVNRLPCLIRQFILFDDESTIELDIKSAAASSMTRMIADQEERKQWQSLILKGSFYQTLAEYLTDCGKDCDIKGAKDLFTKFLGGHPHTRLIQDWIYGMFPKFYDHIVYKFDNGELAQDTQRLESKAIVGDCGHLGASIHDCLLVKASEKELVLDHMHKACQKHFGTKVIIDEK